MAKRQSTLNGRRARSVSVSIARSGSKRSRTARLRTLKSTLEAQVARQRLQLFRVRAVLECAGFALEYGHDTECRGSDVSLALEVARGLVEQVIGELDSERLAALRKKSSGR
jgi:hypothetical protein